MSVRVSWETKALSKVTADVLVLPLYLQEDLGKLLGSLDKTINKESISRLKAAADEDGFVGKLGQQQWLHLLASGAAGNLPWKKVCLYGLGKEADVTLTTYRKMGAQISRRLSGLPGSAAAPVANARAKSKSAGAAPTGRTRLVSICLRESKKIGLEESLSACLEGYVLAAFNFLKYKTRGEATKKEVPFLERWSLSFGGGNLAKAKFDQSVKQALALAESTNLARELIAEPPTAMTPTRLSQEAKRIAKEQGLEIKVLDAAQVEKLGMGSFLGVARGAKEPLKFIAMRYHYARSKKTIGLVGKGITFDSGGLSLKTAVGMEHMKYDMSGAAAVICAMQVIGMMKPKVSVLAVVAATENMPGDNALHPGDVLTSMNGKTIEVNNTDAEGRLILADAITYAIKEGADEIIDIATLTGAVVTCLGRVAAGIMGSAQPMVDAVIESGKCCGEQYWQLPLFEEYKEGLKSDIADLKNAGSRGEAGTSSAAMFLKEFTENKPWVHLDIAGPGWIDRDKDEINKGGTGFGVRTLSHYVLKH